jgi:putative transposase
MSVITFAIGSVVHCRTEEAVVVDYATADSVLVCFSRTGKLEVAQASEVESGVITGVSSRAERLCREAAALISDSRWAAAKERIYILRELLNRSRYSRGVAMVEAAAAKLDRSVATVYRLLGEYDRHRSLRVMLRLVRVDKGISRLPPKIERCIRAVIKKEYLDQQRNSVETVANTIQRRCRRKGWPAPSKATIVRRIGLIAPVDAANAREGRSGARGRLEQQIGRHPDVHHPLELVHLDHTPSNYCIVDDVHRLPIEGEQTLSVALDINTRCILGFTLSLEAPSVRLAGACMAFAILPKEKFLQEMGVDAYWPCYGAPSVLYTDSGPDFRASDLLKALELYGIEPRKRPKKSPNYAGHIESLFSKFLPRIHQLEGSRFGNLKNRLNYDSQGRAIMTLHEFRRWFTLFITTDYHQEPHSALDDLPPIKAWERGIIGYGTTPGIGLPDRYSDELRVRLEFLPSERRVVHPDGIHIGRCTFNSSALARWVGAKNPNESDGKFIIKYDPYDFSEVYFLDPELGEYVPVERETESPYLTRWEIELVKRALRKENRELVDQRAIDKGAETMREDRRESARKTHAARRAQQRLDDSAKQSIPRARRQQEAEDERFMFSDVAPQVDPSDDGDAGPLAPVRGGVAAPVVYKR